MAVLDYFVHGFGECTKTKTGELCPSGLHTVALSHSTCVQPKPIEWLKLSSCSDRSLVLGVNVNLTFYSAWALRPMILEDLHCLQHLLKEYLSSHWQINLTEILIFSYIMIIFVIVRLPLQHVQQHKLLQSNHWLMHPWENFKKWCPFQAPVHQW